MHLLYSLLICGILQLVSAFEFGDGAIGIGIATRRPLCAYACRDALSSLYLDCTKIVGNKDGQDIAITTPACRRSNVPWLSSLAYCFEQKCGNENTQESLTESAWWAIVGRNPGVADYPYSLPSKPPTSQLKLDDISLNETSLVNDELYDAVLLALQEVEFQEDTHTLLSTIIPVAAALVCLLLGLYRTLATYFPTASFLPSSLSRWISSRLLLPGLVRSHHLQPLPYNLGYAPSRAVSLLVFLYIYANIIFSVLPIASGYPSSSLFAHRADLVGFISNRTGVLSFANLAIAIITAGRNNIFLPITGCSYTTFITFHRWSARVATVQAIVHSIIYSAIYFWSNIASLYYTEATIRNYWWGTIGTIAMSLAVAFSVLPVRLRIYEPFVLVHIILAVVVIMGCWYHVDFRSSRIWGYKSWLYLCIAFWGFDRAVRFARIVQRNWFGKASRAYAELLPGNEIIKVTVYPSMSWKPRSGQFCFLYVPSLGRFYESHPFSIAYWNDGPAGNLAMESRTHQIHDVERGETTIRSSSLPSPTKKDKEIGKGHVLTSKFSIASVDLDAIYDKPDSTTGSFTFLIRPKTGMTYHLCTSLALSSGKRTPLSVTLEGPYGYMKPTYLFPTVLCIAGGIGISSMLAVIQEHKERWENSTCSNRLVLVWSARERSLIEFVRSKLPRDPERYGMEFRITCTGDGSLTLRVDLRSVIEGEVARAQKLAVVVCGPAKMSDQVREEVVRNVRKGADVQLHEEAFAW